MSRIWEAIAVLGVFVLLATLNYTTLTAAHTAEEEATQVRKELERINVPAQNRCIVKVVLSFPPPIQEDDFETVLQEYDDCIEEEAGRLDLQEGGDEE